MTYKETLAIETADPRLETTDTRSDTGTVPPTADGTPASTGAEAPAAGGTPASTGAVDPAAGRTSASTGHAVGHTGGHAGRHTGGPACSRDKEGRRRPSIPHPRKVLRACAFFFACPGLAYGLFTSRLPGLKAQTGADEAQVGLLLLGLGMASVCSLLAGGWIVDRLGSRVATGIAAPVLLVAVTACGFAGSPAALALAMILAGAAMGLCDVAMNAQGIQLERTLRISCMAFMHACYSLGGVLGALTGALFAGLSLSPFLNAVAVLGLYALGIAPALRLLLDKEEPPPMSRQSGQSGPSEPCDSAQISKHVSSPTSTDVSLSRASDPAASAPDTDLQDAPSPIPSAEGVSQGSLLPPLFVILCGLLSMLCYAAEGSVAEWGGLLLHTVKGSSESAAALVFAVFSSVVVLCRLRVDRLRKRTGDAPLVLFGALLAAFAMGCVLVFSNPFVCLAGYALMGLGLAPIVPLLFSRAGACPGVSPGRASATVAFLSYSGLLFFPPLLGFAANAFGLERALVIVFVVCLIIAAGALVLRSHGSGQHGHGHG